MNPWWRRPTADGGGEESPDQERTSVAGSTKRSETSEPEGDDRRPATTGAAAPAAQTHTSNEVDRESRSRGDSATGSSTKTAPTPKMPPPRRRTDSAKAEAPAEGVARLTDVAQGTEVDLDEGEPHDESPSRTPADGKSAVDAESREPTRSRTRRRSPRRKAPTGRDSLEPATSESTEPKPRPRPTSVRKPTEVPVEVSSQGADLGELLRDLLLSAPERSQPSSYERKIAMFCDLENIALGVRDSDIKKFDINLVLERLLEKGKIIVKKSYADWERYSEYKRGMHGAAIEMIDIPQKYYSGKNSADIKMVVDAMDLCYSKEHLDTFVLLSGDSDFSPLVSKLKENNKYVIGCGVKNSSSNLLIDNCDEFIYYEDIWRDSQNAPLLEGLGEDKDKAQAFGLMTDAITALTRENKEVLWGSMIKQTMQRKRPSFNEGYYGYSTFSDLLEDAQSQGLIKLKKDQRSGTYVVTGFSQGR